MGYGVNRLKGDYGVRMRGRRGDPGFLGSLLGGVAGLIPGGSAILSGVRAVAGAFAGGSKPAGAAVLPVPGIAGMVQRLAPGGATGLYVAGGGRRRRMNPANSKALSRAIRRINSFGSLVARSKRSVAKANRAIGNVQHRSTVRRRK